MTNNFDKVREFLIGDYCGFPVHAEASIFQIQIIKRRKDEGNDSMISGAQILKSYYIHSSAHFDSKIDEIQKLCDIWNARAYINLNPKTKRQIVRNLARHSFELALQDEVDSLNLSGIIDSAVASLNAPHNMKSWVFDLDTKDNEAFEKLYNKIESLSGSVLMVLDTPNGCHLITTPFHYNDTNWIEYQCELKKNSNTVLYKGDAE